MKLNEKDDTLLAKIIRGIGCFVDIDYERTDNLMSKYITVYRRLSFNFVLLIIIFLCGFLGFLSGGRGDREEDYYGPAFGPFILALSLIFVLYNFTSKSTEVNDRLYTIYNYLVDLYYISLNLDANYVDKSVITFIRNIYFFFLTSTIFIILRYGSSTKEIIITIIWKFFIFLILLVTNTHTKNVSNLVCEIFYFIFWALSIFLFSEFRNDLIEKSQQFYSEQQYENQYLQGLINTINKSFLSLNITLNKISFNKPFENLLKSVGLRDEQILANLNDKENSRLIQINFNNQTFMNNNNDPQINQGQNIEMAEQRETVNNFNTNANLNMNSQGKNNLNANKNNFVFLNKSNKNLIINNNSAFNNSGVPFNSSVNENFKLNNSMNFNNSNIKDKNNNNNNNFNNNNNNFNNNNNNFNNNNNNFNNNNNNFNNNINFNNNFNNFNNNNNNRNNNNNLNNNFNNKNNFNNNNRNNNNFNFDNNNSNNINRDTNFNNFSNNNDNNINNFNNNNINNLNKNFNNFNNNNNFNRNNNNFNFNNNNFNNFSNNNNFNRNNTNFNNFNNFNNINNFKISDEDIFLQKLDFIMSQFSDNFFEENNNMNNSNMSGINNDQNNLIIRQSMSGAIRDIFYSRFKLNLNEEFTLKGIYSSLPGYPQQMTLELYYRKILTYQGELVELYFNDITSLRQIESEKALNNVRSLVLAKISNEFKTPLINIIYILKNYYSKNLFKNESTAIQLRGTANQNQIPADEYIRNTIDLSDYMLSLINDISDYSISNSEFDFKCEFEPFDIYETLEFSFRILKNLLKCKGQNDSIKPLLEIDPNIPKNFTNDEKRIKQILLNLISNSIKYTKKGFIKIAAKIMQDGLIRISVEDTGCGIGADVIQKLFNDVYVKEDIEKGQKISTTGLGLSISKKIIDKIGTKIECSSIVSQKTIFTFFIENKEDLLTNDQTEGISFLEDSKNPAFFSSYVPNNKRDNQFSQQASPIRQDNNRNINFSRNNSNNTSFVENRKKNSATQRNTPSAFNNQRAQKPEDEEETLILSLRDIPTELGNLDEEISDSIYKKDKKLSLESINSFIRPVINYLSSMKKNIILYVDDNELIRKSYKKLFYMNEKIGCETEIINCKDGAEAFYILYLDYFFEKKIKLVVSDDKMNLMDGEDLYNLMLNYQNNKFMTSIPFVLLNSEKDKCQNLTNIGENLYNIKKNLKIEDITKILELLDE
jgi:signal transduction histidine kinase